MNNKLNINTQTLRSLHLFGDLYEQAIVSAKSDIAVFAPDRASPDCIGAHWYGMRVHVQYKNTDHKFYLHTGFVFLPQTRTGLMVELDKNSNPRDYEKVWDRVRAGKTFEVNRDEAIYLKLFMPDSDFIKLNQSGPEEQGRMLTAFFKDCAEAICLAAGQDTFRLDYNDLANSLGLTRAYREALDEVKSSEYCVQPNDKDPDNFGQYAAGFRYWLKDLKGPNRFYAYFGGIYSYKKDPAGVFAEIDWLNNQVVFSKAFEAIESDDIFVFSQAEPKFIKLFMSPDLTKRFNEAGGDEQREILKEFLHACNTAMVLAAR